MGMINEIFREFGPEYIRRFGNSMPGEHKKVIAAIIACRTEENGSLVYQCEECGESHVLHRSCGNRHCPQCQGHKTRQWLERQFKRQLPGHHFMVTYTVPEEIRPFLRSHQRIGYAALFAASTEAMKKLAQDPKYIGGDMSGFFGVLHTWGRQLQYHPHIHFIVPGGALSSKDGRWHASGEAFYLPVLALSPIFRAKFRDRMEKAGLLDQIPAEVWQKEWNVNCQAVGDGSASIKYLAPYVFRVAISDSRMIKVEDGKVFFHYRQQKSNRQRTMELTVMEFMHRFLQHVLPTGFMKVRYYGFLSPASNLPLDEVRARIELAYAFNVKERVTELEPLPAMTCRHCGGNGLRYIFFTLPKPRFPTGPAG
jgi:hypothetical protein